MRHVEGVVLIGQADWLVGCLVDSIGTVRG